MLGNSTRILLGHKPGKQRKKRRLAKDMAIWRPKAGQAQLTAKEQPGQPSALSGRKITISKNQQSNYLLKQQ